MNGINCRECGIGVCDYDRLTNGLCSKCIKTYIAKENKQMDNDWKDLEIGNIPSDFFVNDRYEIERKITVIYHPILKGDSKSKIIYELELGAEYRYKLKDLESIRISQNVHDFIYIQLNKKDYVPNFDSKMSGLTIEELDGCKVEIID